LAIFADTPPPLAISLIDATLFMAER